VQVLLPPPLFPSSCCMLPIAYCSFAATFSHFSQLTFPQPASAADCAVAFRCPALFQGLSKFPPLAFLT
jgi:hypothetical protein